ncbi:MAG TPA: PP2C family serine/threonine-protein phosphatase [Ktedonobacterales bacterium]|jgi:protein phosphatase|nr:PP2C family serine/threonine-protein phosphatase [Ktedonobacterales bacterium]
MALRLVAATHTDPGLQREQNEDASHAQVGEDPTRATGLFIVADGMGGYHAGEVASRLAVETIRDDLQPLLGSPATQPTVRLNRRRKGARGARAAKDTIPLANQGVGEATGDASGDASGEATGDAASPALQSGPATQILAESLAMEQYGERLREAVEHCGEVIVRYDKAHRDEAKGLGSTLTAALVVDGQAYIANVGDSRTYLLRDGKLQRITRDHSLVERLVEAGQIEADEVYDHPNRNLIYRSLGAGKADVDVDIFTEPLRAGDLLVLCCDGLWEMVRDPEMTSILLAEPDLERASKELIDRANHNGGEDNITVVLVRCEEG